MIKCFGNPLDEENEGRATRRVQAGNTWAIRKTSRIPFPLHLRWVTYKYVACTRPFSMHSDL
jgi:hypothetical protein